MRRWLSRLLWLLLAAGMFPETSVRAEDSVAAERVECREASEDEEVDEEEATESGPTEPLRVMAVRAVAPAPMVLAAPIGMGTPDLTLSPVATARTMRMVLVAPAAPRPTTLQETTAPSVSAASSMSMHATLPTLVLPDASVPLAAGSAANHVPPVILLLSARVRPAALAAPAVAGGDAALPAMALHPTDVLSTLFAAPPLKASEAESVMAVSLVRAMPMAVTMPETEFPSRPPAKRAAAPTMPTVRTPGGLAAADFRMEPTGGNSVVVPSAPPKPDPSQSVRPMGASVAAAPTGPGRAVLDIPIAPKANATPRMPPSVETPPAPAIAAAWSAPAFHVRDRSRFLDEIMLYDRDFAAVALAARPLPFVADAGRLPPVAVDAAPPGSLASIHPAALARAESRQLASLSAGLPAGSAGEWAFASPKYADGRLAPGDMTRLPFRGRAEFDFSWSGGSGAAPAFVALSPHQYAGASALSFALPGADVSWRGVALPRQERFPFAFAESLPEGDWYRPGGFVPSAAATPSMDMAAQGAHAAAAWTTPWTGVMSPQAGTIAEHLFAPATTASANGPLVVPAAAAVGPVALSEAAADSPAVSAGGAWSWVSLERQLAMGGNLLARRMARDIVPERITPAEAEMALRACAERMDRADDRAERERWIDRAWGYWRRLRPSKDLAPFGDWLDRVLGDRLSPARKTYLLARIANDLGATDDCRNYLGRLEGDAEADGFRDEILLLTAVVDLRQERPDAAAGLERLVRQYPESPLLPRAMFLLAWNDLMAGREADCRGRLDALLARYPDDPLSPRARELLEGLQPRPAPPPPKRKDRRPPPAPPQTDDVF